MSLGIPGARNVDHIGVSVLNLDQAISFFRDVLGAKFLFRFGQGPGTETPADLEKTLGVGPTSKLRIALMRLGPSLNVELMEYRASGQNCSVPKNSDADVPHIAFWVEDMEMEDGVAAMLNPAASPAMETGCDEEGLWSVSPP